MTWYCAIKCERLSYDKYCTSPWSWELELLVPQSELLQNNLELEFNIETRRGKWNLFLQGSFLHFFFFICKYRALVKEGNHFFFFFLRHKQKINEVKWRNGERKLVLNQNLDHWICEHEITAYSVWQENHTGFISYRKKKNSSLQSFYSSTCKECLCDLIRRLRRGGRCILRWQAHNSALLLPLGLHISRQSKLLSSRNLFPEAILALSHSLSPEMGHAASLLHLQLIESYPTALPAPLLKSCRISHHPKRIQ